jgi:pimeloyl-ACP methyl ester carboxylesterase
MPKLSLIAHSWGTVPAILHTLENATHVDRLALFAPPLYRQLKIPDKSLPSWDLITVEDQRQRFIKDTPKDHASVLAEPVLAQWGKAWLATDPTSSTRTPPSVKIPTGPQADFMTLWRGTHLYDASLIKPPTLVVRGAWDSVCTSADVAGLRAQGLKFEERIIPESGHLAHLENNRALLWAAITGFLKDIV